VREEPDKQQKPDFLDDFDNCKGQCGYTPWCKDCRESKKEAETSIPGNYAESFPDEQGD